MLTIFHRWSLKLSLPLLKVGSLLRMYRFWPPCTGDRLVSTISIPLCRIYLIPKKKPINLPLMIFSSVRMTRFSTWSTIQNSMSSMAISESLLISYLVNILKVSKTKFTCPSMAMRLSILVTNGIRLLWPMPCLYTNPKGVNSQSLSFPSHAKVGVCFNVTSSTPLSHAPRVNWSCWEKSQPSIMPFTARGPNVIPTSSNVLNKLIHKLLISLSKRMLKTREQTPSIKQKRKTIDPQKPLKTKTSRKISIHPKLLLTLIHILWISLLTNLCKQKKTIV